MFPDVHELFPPSVQNNADIARFQKFLMLLTQKPKNTAQIEDEFDDEFDYDDAPAIELVVGKKPGISFFEFLFIYFSNKKSFC